MTSSIGSGCRRAASLPRHGANALALDRLRRHCVWAGGQLLRLDWPHGGGGFLSCLNFSPPIRQSNPGRKLPTKKLTFGAFDALMPAAAINRVPSTRRQTPTAFIAVTRSCRALCLPRVSHARTMARPTDQGRDYRPIRVPRSGTKMRLVALARGGDEGLCRSRGPAGHFLPPGR